MGVIGSRWTRLLDGATVKILEDPIPSDRSDRGLLAINEVTRIRFWVTPKLLDQDYEEIS